VNLGRLENRPYSPDMLPGNIFIFPKMKNTLKGMRFQDVIDMKKNVQLNVLCNFWEDINSVLQLTEIILKESGIYFFLIHVYIPVD
jgi:hypothetical protein